MRISILTFDGFNEIDALLALNLLNRSGNIQAEIVAPTEKLVSMNGLEIRAQNSLESLSESDAVIVGSGRNTSEIVSNLDSFVPLNLDPEKQLIASQCSGALLLHALGLLNNRQVCTDSVSTPKLSAIGYDVLNQPFVAHGNVATAGGCMSAPFICTWLISRLFGIEEAKSALRIIAPVGQTEPFIENAIEVVLPFIS